MSQVCHKHTPLLLVGMVLKPTQSFTGQPITLSRATRGIGLCTFDPYVFHGRIEVVVPKRRAVGQTQGLHQIVTAQFAAPNCTDQCRYLVAYLVAYLVGRHSLTDCIAQRTQHELDKKSSICLLVSRRECRNHHLRKYLRLCLARGFRSRTECFLAPSSRHARRLRPFAHFEAAQ